MRNGKTILPPLAPPQVRGQRHRPLSDQEAGTRQHPAQPAGIVTRPHQALPPGTPREVLEALQAHAQTSRDQVAAIKALMRRLDGPRVLETATVTIPAAGVFVQDRYRVPYASVAVLNYSANAITVSSGAAQGSAPGGGQGQFNVPANCFVALPLEGSSIAFYGTPAATFSYVVMLDRCQPAAATI